MSGQNEIEVRMLPVHQCYIDEHPDRDCPFFEKDFYEDEDGVRPFCMCWMQDDDVKAYIDDDGDAFECETSARKELFRTCPLPKAGKKGGGE